MNMESKLGSRIEFSNIYAVEFIGWGSLEDANNNASGFILSNKIEVRL